MSEAANELLAVIEQLSFARELDAVMAIVRRAARRITGADGATFILREGGNCYYADEDAIAPLWKGLRFPMHACISGWVMRHGTAAVIEDIYADARIPAEAYRPTFVRSLAVVPVRSADPVAALGAYWATMRRPTDEEVGFLQTLADATALALANVELYQGLRAALAKEQTARAETQAALDRLRQSEAEREAAFLRAETANRAKDEILMVLSHELRTPLMPLLGWARMLQAGVCDPEAVSRGLAAIERNARVELELVDELLDVSEMIAGRLEIERRPVDLLAAVQTALHKFAPAAESKSIRIERVIDVAGCRVLGDPPRIQQIFENLLSNAVKYTPAEGRIHVRAAQEGALARITIRDTGPGFPPHLLEGIFDRFSRVDASTSREHRGLGLGLAITRHLVELHGGRVEAGNAGPEGGATFTVCLPLISHLPDQPRALEMSGAESRT